MLQISEKIFSLNNVYENVVIELGVYVHVLSRNLLKIKLLYRRTFNEDSQTVVKGGILHLIPQFSLHTCHGTKSSFTVSCTDWNDKADLH